MEFCRVFWEKRGMIIRRENVVEERLRVLCADIVCQFDG